jgi:hypothetical protein
MNNKIKIKTTGGKRMQNKSMSRNTAVEPAETDLALKAGAAFPGARYFQIHFEYLQEQLHLTRDVLHELQMQMQQLQQQLPGKVNLQASETGSSTQQRRR